MTTLDLKAFGDMQSAMNRPRRLCMRIGGIRLDLTALPQDMYLAVEPDMQSFVTDPGKADVCVEAEWADGIEPDSSEPLFDTGSIWRLLRGEKDGYKFEFSTP